VLTKPALSMYFFIFAAMFKVFPNFSDASWNNWSS
jgi:hypothetical protein